MSTNLSLTEKKVHKGSVLYTYILVFPNRQSFPVRNYRGDLLFPLFFKFTGNSQLE